jgi:basic membrane lipoprotein Med (substrate-binding protein (PBP1-ABC) superfamily)
MEAGFLSKTGKGGFVGGQALPPVKTAADAFGKGAMAVVPKFSYQETYIGNWSDVAAAKGQAEALLSNGSDVISQNCDAAAKGLFDAANKPGVYTFGANSDQNAMAPNVFSSFILDVPKAFDDLAKQVKAGTAQGAPLTLGLKSGDVRVLDNPKFASVLTAAQKAQIAKAIQDIEDGKIKVTGK